MTAFDITGGSFAGKGPNERPDIIDEYERKEYLRKNRRRPLVETIADVGEGRGKLTSAPMPFYQPSLSQLNRTHHEMAGINPPGYEERRRERLQAKYGVEINPVKATVDDAE